MTLGYLFNQRDWNTYIVVEYTRRGIRYLCGIICDQKLIRWTKKDPNLWKNPIWDLLSILIMSLIAMDHILKFLFWSFWQKIKQPYPVLGSSFHEGLFSSPVKIVLHPLALGVIFRAVLKWLLMKWKHHFESIRVTLSKSTLIQNVSHQSITTAALKIKV